MVKQDQLNVTALLSPPAVKTSFPTPLPFLGLGNWSAFLAGYLSEAFVGCRPSIYLSPWAA